MSLCTETQENSEVPAWVIIENMRGNEIEIKDHKLVKCEVSTDLILKGIDEICCDITANGKCNPTVTILGDLKYTGEKVYDIYPNIINYVAKTKNTYDVLNKIICDLGVRHNVRYGDEKVSDVRFAVLNHWDALDEDIDDIEIDLSLTGNWVLDYEGTYKAVTEAIEIKINDWNEWNGKVGKVVSDSELAKEIKRYLEEINRKDAIKYYKLNEIAINDLIVEYTAKERE